MADRPTAADGQPTMPPRRPPSADGQPTTAARRPTTTGGQPAAPAGQPTTSGERAETTARERSRPTTTRRGLLLTGAAGLAGLAGCLRDAGSASRAPAPVADPPDAVYYPSHVEGMAMGGMAQAGPLRVALAFSFPHRFWTITGRELNEVTVGGDDDVHLMATVWHADAGVVLPTAELSVELRLDGERVVDRSLWAMLSQRMGYHFGDNVSLAGDGQYEATVTVGAAPSRLTGALADVPTERVTVDVGFEYSEAAREEIPFERLDERAGQRGAVEPMEMGTMPVASAPSAEELPGRTVGEAESSDAAVVATVLEDAGRFVDGDRSYLAVSPRTPYNGFPLPFAALSATQLRGGSTRFEDSLRATLDPELGYHYGAALDGVETGDVVSVVFDAPPQISRHEGYETAFLEHSPAQFTVE